MIYSRHWHGRAQTPGGGYKRLVNKTLAIEKRKGAEQRKGYRRSTRSELQEQADQLLIDAGPTKDILNQEQLKARRKREIYVASGTPDPSIEQGMYWRTHPQGRKTNDEEARRNHAAGFYKG